MLKDLQDCCAQLQFCVFSVFSGQCCSMYIPTTEYCALHLGSEVNAYAAFHTVNKYPPPLSLATWLHNYQTTFNIATIHILIAQVVKSVSVHAGIHTLGVDVFVCGHFWKNQPSHGMARSLL